jgi:hypothetical protein
MVKRLTSIGIILLLTAVLIPNEADVLGRPCLLDPPFWEGTVTLVENTTIDITAHNSGASYTIASTTVLGALDAASKQGAFDYTVTDEWYDQFGSLLVNTIAGQGPEGLDGWQFWVNYPDEPLPWVGPDNLNIRDGDLVDWFYGGFGDVPDTSSMLIKIHVSTIKDVTAPTVEIMKPKNGGLYIFNREIIAGLGTYTFVFGEITVEVNAADALSTVAQIEFYMDGTLKETITEGIYRWHWSESAMGRHTIKVVAYDEAGNFAEMERIILIFSL